MSVLFIPLLHLLACSDDAQVEAVPAPGASAAREDDDVLGSVVRTDLRAFAGNADTFAFVNPAWSLDGLLDPDGLKVGRTDGELRMRFAAWGRDGDLQEVEAVAPAIGACVHEVRPDGGCARQVEFAHVGATEWWANLAEGLEQGWDLDQRPAGEGPLLIEVEVSGAIVDGDEAELWLTTDDGTAYRYSALAAWDARGDALDAWFEVTDAGLRIVVDDEGAEWPITVDPVLTTASTTLDGETTSNSFGYAVERAGDVNNDGYDDLVVGAYGYSTNTGRAYVFHGSASGISTTAATTLTGGGTSEYFGAAARGAGDVDNDGYDDLVVGAYGASEATVYFGSSTGITTTGSVLLSGTSSSTGFGNAVSGLGDVNDDGFDDVGVGEYKYSTNIGRLSVFHGSASFDSTADTTIGGGSTSYFGWAVDGAGDVNDDGYDDVIVGAYYYSSYKGRAYVFHGSSTGVSGSPTTTLTGGSNNYYMGYDVAGAGDVNNDGYADIIVSMYGYNSLGGRAQVLHGSSSGVDTTVDTNLDGATAAYEFGFAVDGDIDVNADGYSDVVVGERKYSSNVGRAYVYPGSSSGVSTTADTTFSGTSGSQFGRAVAGVGDVNGDGYGDVAVGGSALTSSTGRAWVFHGYVDEDGDGYVLGGNGTSEDCDDTDATINPGATDVTGDGIDSDCDGGEVCYVDADDDGYRLSTTVTSTDSDCSDSGEALSSAPTGDCDDTDATANPGETETVADGVDNDCDGNETCYVDADNDGYRLSTTVTATDGDCADSGEALASDPDSDCNDALSSINPGKTEVTGNNYDENCDGSATCYVDADDDTYRTTSTVASADGDCRDSGEALAFDTSGDCNDAVAAINPGATEVCDASNTDEDCDSLADDADSSVSAATKTTYYVDDDGDTYGDAANTTLACDPVAGATTDSTDCDDTNGAVNPGATEVCDAADTDEDCDGFADDDDSSVTGGGVWYADSDSDGYGDAGSVVASCDGVPGYVGDSTDCDDSSASVNPGATESTGDEIDGDCDGSEDCFTDNDADTYRTSDVVASADSDCADPGEANAALSSGDCDDNAVGVNPGASEVQGDEIDGNCDGSEDCFTDADSDGYSSDDGAINTSSDADCTDVGEATASAPGGDCDDFDSLYNPGASETCDDPNDYNCDGTVAYLDNDGDGAAACEDCDDGNSAAYPGAIEVVANEVDENCDGGEDCYIDADVDGTRVDDTTVASTDADCDDAGETNRDGLSGDCNDADAAYFPGAVETDCLDPNDYNCDGSVGYADEDGDTFAACEECDDLNALINPNGTEVCNDLDDNCDGAVDVDAIDASTWYADADGDSYGNEEVVTASCDQPDNFVVDSTDCDDADGTSHPGGEEVANDGIDQDCDGEDLIDTGDTGDTGDTADTGTETGDTDTGTPGDTDTDTDVAGGGGCACDTSTPGTAAAGAGLAVAALAVARRRRRS